MKTERTCSKIKTTQRETFTFKNPTNQVYARVTEVLGHGHFTCICDDLKLRNCHIRGNMRDRIFVNQHDLVLVDLLVGLSGCDVKGVISARYSDEQVRQLIQTEQIAENFAYPPPTSGASTHATGFEFV